MATTKAPRQYQCCLCCEHDKRLGQHRFPDNSHAFPCEECGQDNPEGVIPRG